MLTEWLAPHDFAWFTEHHLGRAPYAVPGAAVGAVPAVVRRPSIACSAAAAAPGRCTVSAGKMVETPPPRSAADVARLGAGGVSVVVRGAEAHDDGLAGLARSFANLVPGEVHVQLYMTPAGTNSYGWHYDFEHVFIAQTAGVKDYYFRANTVALDTRLGEPLDFPSFRRETSPILAARLVAGDWLYLPPRWWHLVKCVEQSLSISTGVMPPEALQTASRLPAGWTGLPPRPRGERGRAGGSPFGRASRPSVSEDGALGLAFCVNRDPQRFDGSTAQPAAHRSLTPAQSIPRTSVPRRPSRTRQAW